MGSYHTICYSQSQSSISCNTISEFLVTTCITMYFFKNIFDKRPSTLPTVHRYNGGNQTCSQSSINQSIDKPMPVVALTTSMAKSGEYPVKPNTVVLRYLWWPQRSMKDISFVEFSQISSTVLESL